MLFAVWKCVRGLCSRSIAPKQSDDNIYDPNLVPQLFLRTLETDIASLYVLSEIKPYLKSGSVNDEALILAVTKAATVERDREENFFIYLSRTARFCSAKRGN